VSKRDPLWAEESDRYAERNLGKERSRHLIDFLKRAGIRFSTVLQIGCSTGDQLAQVVEEFGCQATGIEPGKRAVEIAQSRWPHIHFQRGWAQDLPFEDNTFELVIFSGVIYWIPRSYVYHAIGESIRVSSRYILVGEFYPSVPYSTRYRDYPVNQARTFKISSLAAYLSLGLVRLLCQETIFNEEGDWERRSAYLYEKVGLDEAYPLHDRDDFAR